jgi:hypothetical protein
LWRLALGRSRGLVLDIADLAEMRARRSELGEDRGVTEPAPSYRLRNGEEMNREHPRTFFIPSRDERDSLVAGQLVKLIFDAPGPGPDGPGAERMWVVVGGRSGAGYFGQLDNQPTTIERLSAGDRIEFAAEHVVSIWEDRPELELKALVSRRSHEQDLRPGYLYRDTPHNPMDSGWQVLVGDETEAEVSDAAQALLQPLGFVLERWPELRVPFADQDERSEWSWEPGTATYVRLR